MNCPICNETKHNPAAKYCFRCGARLHRITDKILCNDDGAIYSRNPLLKRNGIVPYAFLKMMNDQFKHIWEPHIEDNGHSITVKLFTSSFKMIKVEGGIYKMGTQDDDPAAENYYKYTDEDTYPPHQVSLDAYFIGETVVTRGLWERVMKDNKYFCCEDEDLPVNDVTYEDCQQFITTLNLKTGLDFRLPTEAEWEIAARGGNKSRGYKYSGSNELNKVGWSDQSRNRQLHPVKMKRHNELGIYDMSGNVWEWCSDWFGPYSDKPQNNPRGPQWSQYNSRVLRGGSWADNSIFCYVGQRFSSRPDNPPANCGFRLALTINHKTDTQ